MAVRLDDSVIGPVAGCPVFMKHFQWDVSGRDCEVRLASMLFQSFASAWSRLAFKKIEMMRVVV